MSSPDPKSGTDFRNTKFTTVTGFSLLVLFWGLFPVATKLAIQDAPPFLLSSLRLGIATCIMLLTSKLILRQTLRLTWKQYKQVFLLGILIAGVPTGAFATALKFSPAGTVSVIWATAPIFTAIFNMRGEGEIRGWRLVFSLTIGLMGVTLVLVGNSLFLLLSSRNPGFTLTHGGFTLLSELAVLGSAALTGFASRIAKQCVTVIPIATLTFWQVLFASLFLAAMSLLFEHGLPVRFTWTAISILFYTGIICSCGCNFLGFWLIRRIGAIRTAHSDFIVPAVTLLLSFVFLGESITIVNIGGLILVLLGAAFLS